MQGPGLTRARTIAPIAETVAAAGGSIERVFRRAEMPPTVLDVPDRLILLRDQFRLVEAAIREIGDPTLPVRLSTPTGIAGLGSIGLRIRATDTLGAALQMVEVVSPSVLQTATWVGLRRRSTTAFFGYAVTEGIERGRQSNELLALGYLLGTVRHFLGPGWQPQRAVVTGASLPMRAGIEALLGCEIVLGPRAGLAFPAHDLECPNSNRLHWSAASDQQAIGGDLATCVAHVIESRLDDARPSVIEVARRLGLSRRTLQRRLDDAGARFTDIQRGVLVRRAKLLLSTTTLPIGRIALDLGYADAAHFSRAFLNWSGRTPSGWRRKGRAEDVSRAD